MNPHRQSMFHFKRFSLSNSRSAMKVGTDGVLLGAWAELHTERHDAAVLDVGCGTGVIALMLAQRYPNARIKCVDISDYAVAECGENIDNSPYANRVEVEAADFRTFADEQMYDLIVSNPPFFTEQLHSPDEQRAAARHEDSLPLSMLINRCASLLAPDGRVALVLPAARDEEVMLEATLAGLTPSRRCRVFTREGKPTRRTLWELSRSSGMALIESQLIIHEADGKFTDEYIALVKDFYLEF